MTLASWQHGVWALGMFAWLQLGMCEVRHLWILAFEHVPFHGGSTTSYLCFLFATCFTGQRAPWAIFQFKTSASRTFGFHCHKLAAEPWSGAFPRLLPWSFLVTGSRIWRDGPAALWFSAMLEWMLSRVSLAELVLHQRLAYLLAVRCLSWILVAPRLRHPQLKLEGD